MIRCDNFWLEDDLVYNVREYFKIFVSNLSFSWAKWFLEDGEQKTLEWWIC